MFSYKETFFFTITIISFGNSDIISFFSGRDEVLLLLITISAVIGGLGNFERGQAIPLCL